MRAMQSPTNTERTTRNGRRRSRQCRGSRVRTLSRADKNAAQTGQLIADATATGAMASFNRLRKRLEKSS